MNASTLIKDARNRAGISQSELATRSGTQQPAIARWESGRCDPSTRTTAKLLRACGYELNTELRPIDVQARQQIRTQLSLTAEQRVEQMLRAIEFIQATRRGLKNAKTESGGVG